LHLVVHIWIHKVCKWKCLHNSVYISVPNVSFIFWQHSSGNTRRTFPWIWSHHDLSTFLLRTNASITR